MRWTRAQLEGDLRTREAQLAAAQAEVRNLRHANERLSAELDEARRHPALAENVRLAHHLEATERERDDAEAALRVAQGTLADLARRYPQAFPKAAS